jgi:hypothetical protein
MQNLIKEFSLVRGAPGDPESRTSLDFALVCIQKRLDKEAFRGTVSYDADGLLRARHWWYIPYCWMGCRGFIVSLKSGYVNWLGSALSLKQCFRGHERGIFGDLVDFTFSPETDTKLAARLLRRFKHNHPNARGVLPKEPVWYRDSEIPGSLLNQFPTFRSHFVWYAIPELTESVEKEGLRFTCSLARYPLE